MSLAVCPGCTLMSFKINLGSRDSDRPGRAVWSHFMYISSCFVVFTFQNDSLSVVENAATLVSLNLTEFFICW